MNGRSPAPRPLPPATHLLGARAKSLPGRCTTGPSRVFDAVDYRRALLHPGSRVSRQVRTRGVRVEHRRGDARGRGALPIVGAVADANHSKRRWLAGTAMCGAAAAVAMARATRLPVAGRGSVRRHVRLLRAIAGALQRISAGNRGRADDQSCFGLGFALGYIGGSAPLVIAWAMVHYGRHHALFGASIRIGQAFCCWGCGRARSACRLFSSSAIAASRPSGANPCRVPRIAAREAGRTLANLRRYPALAMFLLAFLFYNDGMQTVISSRAPWPIRNCTSPSTTCSF